MGIEGPPLSEKGRWPGGELERVRRREQLKVATLYKRTVERKKYGTLGAASKVRHIDPATYKIGEDS